MEPHALRLEDRATTASRLARTGEPPLSRRRVRCVELDRIVVREFLTGPDRTDRDDPHLVAEGDRLAIGLAGVIDEPRRVAAHVRVDHALGVERQQVGVLRFLVPVGRGGVAALALGLADQLARVLDDPCTRRDRRDGEQTTAMTPRASDLPGTPGHFRTRTSPRGPPERRHRRASAAPRPPRCARPRRRAAGPRRIRWGAAAGASRRSRPPWSTHSGT